MLRRNPLAAMSLHRPTRQASTQQLEGAPALPSLGSAEAEEEAEEEAEVRPARLRAEGGEGTFI